MSTEQPGQAYESFEAFDAIHAAGMPPAEFVVEPGAAGELFRGESGVGSGAPPLVGYGASSTLNREPAEDAIPTSVTLPMGAEPATHIPEPTAIPQGIAGGPHPVAQEGGGVSAGERPSYGSSSWSDTSTTGSTGATSAGAGASTGMPGAGAPPSGGGPVAGEARRVTEFPGREERAYPGGLSPAMTQAGVTILAVSAAVAATGFGIVWAIRRGRRIRVERELAKAVEASRLLRFTPPIARSSMLEATRAGVSARNLAQQSAVEAAHMARALNEAVRLSANVARDYATEQATTAQEAWNSALETARERAEDVRERAENVRESTGKAAAQTQRRIWRSIPNRGRWFVRGFNVGRMAGRTQGRLMA